MPFGAPDFSNVQKISTLHRLDDMAELAVRLGSPYIWDRQGDVIYIDHHIYASGLYSLWGNINNVTIMTTSHIASYTGIGTLIIFKTAGTDWIRIRRTFAFIQSQTVGLTVLLSRTAHTGSMEMRLVYVFNEQLNHPGVAFIRNGDFYDLFVYGMGIKIGSVPFRVFSEFTETLIKVVADISHARLRRVIVGPYVFNIDEPYYRTNALPGEAYLGFSYTFYNDPTYGEVIFLEKTIITINEVL